MSLWRFGCGSPALVKSRQQKDLKFWQLWIEKALLAEVLRVPTFINGKEGNRTFSRGAQMKLYFQRLGNIKGKKNIKTSNKMDTFSRRLKPFKWLLIDGLPFSCSPPLCRQKRYFDPEIFRNLSRRLSVSCLPASHQPFYYRKLTPAQLPLCDFLEISNSLGPLGGCCCYAASLSVLPACPWNRAHKNLVKGEQVVRKLGKCVTLPVVEEVMPARKKGKWRKNSRGWEKNCQRRNGTRSATVHTPCLCDCLAVAVVDLL